MIRTFADRETERIWNGQVSRAFPREIQERVRRKLTVLDAAVEIEDLRVPPSNRLERLRGDRAGQWSIRVNNQWRICFEWDEDSSTASGVELVDYH